MPEFILRPVDLEGLIPKALPRPIQPVFESIALGVLAIGQLERIHRLLPQGNPAEFARGARAARRAFDVRSEEQFRSFASI